MNTNLPLHIEINYDPQKVIQSKKRWDAAFDLKVADRPPVAWGISHRLMLPRQQKTFDDLFNDPIDQLLTLVNNWKWMAENLPGDMINDFTLTVQPQFENVSNSNAFGSPVVWHKDRTPFAKSAIRTIEELASFTPPPLEQTLWGKMIVYYNAMKDFLDKGNLKVTMQGHPINIDLQLHCGGEGPFLIATDLCGGKVYEWIYEAPTEMHRLLTLITDYMISTEKKFRQMCGRPEKGRWFHTDDSAQIISLKDYREFVVPYSKRVYDELTEGPNERIMHLCGRHTHLYPALIDDLHVEGMWGYGALNKPNEVRDGLGGKMWLLGNLDPVMLGDGTKEEITQSTEALLEALLPCGGIIVGDGYNLVPETPLQNLQTVVDVVSGYCS